MNKIHGYVWLAQQPNVAVEQPWTVAGGRQTGQDVEYELEPTAARPASRRATGTRNGEHDT